MDDNEAVTLRTQLILALTAQGVPMPETVAEFTIGVIGIAQMLPEKLEAKIAADDAARIHHLAATAAILLEIEGKEVLGAQLLTGVEHLVAAMFEAEAEDEETEEQSA